MCEHRLCQLLADKFADLKILMQLILIFHAFGEPATFPKADARRDENQSDELFDPYCLRSFSVTLFPAAQLLCARHGAAKV